MNCINIILTSNNKWERPRKTCRDWLIYKILWNSNHFKKSIMYFHNYYLLGIFGILPLYFILLLFFQRRSQCRSKRFTQHFFPNLRSCCCFFFAFANVVRIASKTLLLYCIKTACKLLPRVFFFFFLVYCFLAFSLFTPNTFP